MFEELKEILKDKKKKKKIILVGVLSFLLFTNPTMNDFRNFVGESYSSRFGLGASELNKNVNLLAFSIYKSDGSVYLGIAKNFIPLSRSSYH